MPGQSYGLEDGSCSYKDFSGSRNNRFSTPEQAAKNRIQHPSNVLHFFNAPLEVTEENFYEVGAPVPWPDVWLQRVLWGCSPALEQRAATVLALARGMGHRLSCLHAVAGMVAAWLWSLLSNRAKAFLPVQA